MLDAGIDYTHYHLGGSGNVADYNAALAVASGTPPPSLFPTTKVVEVLISAAKSGRTDRWPPIRIHWT
jgi:hypothetical protein